MIASTRGAAQCNSLSAAFLFRSRAVCSDHATVSRARHEHCMVPFRHCYGDQRVYFRPVRTVRVDGADGAIPVAGDVRLSPALSTAVAVEESSARDASQEGLEGIRHARRITQRVYGSVGGETPLLRAGTSITERSRAFGIISCDMVPRNRFGSTSSCAMACLSRATQPLLARR